MNRNGYVYTIVAMMLSLVLLSVVSLYQESYKASTEVSPAKLRTDELHYFVESAKKDAGRATYLSARRGAAYLDDYVINNHSALSDATLTLKQVMVNGTMTIGATTHVVPYMQDNSLTSFMSNLQEKGDELRFRTNVSLRTIDIYMYDSLHFMVYVKYNFSIADQDTSEGGVCGYENENETLYVLVPIDGLEDPLYALATTNKVSRTYNRSAGGGIRTLAYALNGKGLGGGIVYDLSDESGGQDGEIEDYYAANPQLVPYTVFVINTSTDALEWDSFSTSSKTILNLSGGVIDYEDEILATAGFPYVSGISAAINYSGREYVIVKNGNTPQVIYLQTADDIVNRLYANSTNGSCFFDRLEGNDYLTDKYIHQASTAREILGQPDTASVGIESCVNMSDLNSSGLYADITPYENYSSIDYAYFQDTPGRWVYGTPHWFRMDADNLRTKNLTDYDHDDYAAVYHFEEAYDDGSDDYTYDSSHNAPDLELSPNLDITPSSKGGNCLEFGGNPGDTAEAYLNVSEAEYTIGLWFLSDTSCPECGLFSTDTGSDTESDRNIYLNTDMNLCADVYISGQDEICTTDVYSDSDWHYVVHVFSNSSGASGHHQLYVDGELKDTGNYGYSNRTGQARIILGKTPIVEEYFLGYMDDLKIWNRALEEWEIEEEYAKQK